MTFLGGKIVPNEHTEKAFKIMQNKVNNMKWLQKKIAENMLKKISEYSNKLVK